MKLVAKATQFDTGGSVRTAATPTCSSCCCCCCCVATIVSAPILNGTVGAKIAEANELPVAPARSSATWAPVVAMLVAAGAGVFVGTLTDGSIGWPVALGAGSLALVAGIVYSARQAGSPLASIPWTLGLAVSFVLMFVGEGFAGGALVLAAFGTNAILALLYLPLMALIIFGAVKARAKIIGKAPPEKPISSAWDEW